MPNYDYLCATCHKEFEIFQQMSDEALKVCPHCNAPTVKRLIGGGRGLIFKGSGFYVTDQRSKKGSNDG